MLNLLIDLTERGWIPNFLVRSGIRKLCGERLISLEQEAQQNPKMAAQYKHMLEESPVAVATDAANEQHYEVPAEFFRLVLGPNLKYSSAYWSDAVSSLGEAEKAALEITMERAGLQDGMKILELGCGWGSLTLAMAQKFPLSQVTAISNSESQRKFIEAQAKALGLSNLRILTLDFGQLHDMGPHNGTFDRIVSVEMFEHMRNYKTVLQRVRRWLRPGGQLFVHIFTHQKYSYLFETEGSDNWMGKYFFTGGQMPSQSLLASFQDDLKLEKQWEWSGAHYQKTSEAWLQNHIENKKEILEIFTKTYGASGAVRWFHRWEIFFLAVAELFGYSRGHEWQVSHYLFSKKEEV